MKNLIILILLGVSSISCSKDDDSLYEQFYGEWKLIKTEQSETNSSGEVILNIVDYSNQNTIYNFQSNRILLVSWITDSGIGGTQYNYNIEKDYFSNNPIENEIKILLLKLNGAKFKYEFSNGILRIESSHIDEPTLFLERI